MQNAVATKQENKLQFREKISYESLLKNRVLPFQKISNFRDLGGYPTKDGHIVKWNHLFRSGHLAFSTTRDLERFSLLGIDTIIDFRSDEEREREPDLLPQNHDLKVQCLPIQEDGKPPLSNEIRRLIEERALNGHDPSAKMREMYVLLASKFTDAYRHFFQTLLQAEGKPVLWHCSAGKDRAGFASAILLKTLGVPDAIVMQDYLLSQGNLHPRRRQLLTVRLLRGGKAARFLKRMNDVDAEWLLAAFKTIKKDWGNFENYLIWSLEIHSSDIKLLKDYYLI